MPDGIAVVRAAGGEPRSRTTGRHGRTPAGPEWTHGVVAVGMRSRPLTAHDPGLDDDQRAWIGTSDRRFHLVRIVVSLRPRPREILTRARVAFTVQGELSTPMAGVPDAHPVVWSIAPKLVALETTRATKVSVGTKLQLLEMSRETSLEQQRSHIRILGTGELQRQALWDLTAVGDTPLLGDQEFRVVVASPPAAVCMGTAWVAFEVQGLLDRVQSFVARIPPQQETVWLDGLPAPGANSPVTPFQRDRVVAPEQASGDTATSP